MFPMDGMARGTDNRGLDPSSLSANIFPFPRKIEFHIARKPFNGLCNNGDFKLETLNPTSESDFPVHNTEKSTTKKPDIYQGFESFDSDLGIRITLRRIGAGLENLGNTCFMNSVLQCLTYTEPLVAYLQSGKHQISCQIAGFCALCAMQKHVSRVLESTGRILSPKYFVSNLRSISRNFRNARQEDAHEYMVNLLDSMHKCCLPSGLPSESSGAYERSLVHRIFGGRLRSQVKCMQCSFCSNKFDPFLDLSLDIIKTNTLHKSLMYFTATEMLDGGEKEYHCQRCNQKVKALKQLKIEKAPYVLTVHLKRFGSHDIGQKIDKKVEFGLTLDMKPFVSDSHEEELKYTLYGVLVHAGWSTRSGHYFCFIRTSSGMWYSLDDNRVFQVNERTVLEQKAYMLFYVRDRKLSPPMKKPIVVTDTQKETIGSTTSSFLNFDKTAINGTCGNRLSHPSTDLAAFLLEKTSKPTNRSLELPRRPTPAENFCGIRQAGSSEPSSVPENPVNGVSGICENVKPTLPLRVSMEPEFNSGKCMLNGTSAMPEGSSAEPRITSPVTNETEPVTGSDIPEYCRIKASEKCRRKLLKYGLSRIRLSDRVILDSHLKRILKKHSRKPNPPQKKVASFHGSPAPVEVSGPSTSGRIQPNSGPSMSSNFGFHGACSSSAYSGAEKGIDRDDQGTPVCGNGSIHKVLNWHTGTKLGDLEFGRHVARWDDGDDSRSPHGIEERDGEAGKSHIGYILDDWDEEYDMGKRKKVRGKQSRVGVVEGPNPFQEVINKRLKVKQMKLHNSSLLLT